MTIDVFSGYYAAEMTCQGIPRHAAVVKLISDSEGGTITYTALVSFFPHNDEEDFAVSYDACFTAEVFRSPGRRSRKREEKLLENLRNVIDELSEKAGGQVFWDKPLGEAQRG